jgi:hypothetical protein
LLLIGALAAATGGFDMRIIGKLTAALVALSALGAGPAQAYYAWNGFRIEAIGADRLQVYPRGGLTYVDGWCAAGDYVIALLNLPTTTRIWLISEPPRKAKETLVFSLNAEGAASTNGLNVFGDAPLYVTAGAARAYCRQSIEYWTMR